MLIHVRGIIPSASARQEKVMGSMLSPNRVTTKDVKNCTCCCSVRCATFIVYVGGGALALNRPNPLPCTVKTCRQRSYNQRVDCLLCSMAIIYGMGLWTSARCVVLPLVEDRMAIQYQAQVPQHPIDTSDIYHTYINLFCLNAHKFVKLKCKTNLPVPGLWSHS